MGKDTFLDALKRHLEGIDPELQARTLAYYEQRFIDGLAAGRSEDEIATDLDDPKKIAMTLRANSHRAAFAKKKTPVNAVRVLFSFIGLLIFNMFMIVPAAVYAALLAAMYACSIAFYLSGVVVTAGGLSGVHDIVIDGPMRHMRDDEGDRISDTRTKVSIGKDGIHVNPEKMSDDPVEATRAAIEASREAIEASQEAIEHSKGEMEKSKQMTKRALRDALREISKASKDAARDVRDNLDDAIDDGEDAPNRSERVIRRAESVADNGISFSTDLDGGSRTSTAIVGLGLVIGGILLFLLSLVVTRFTLIGLRRYFEMNIALLLGR
jgi:uncharacterized membrane protein